MPQAIIEPRFGPSHFCKQATMIDFNKRSCSAFRDCLGDLLPQLIKAHREVLTDGAMC